MECSAQHASTVVEQIAARLLALANDPVYRFKSATRADAEAFRSRAREFRGCAESDLRARESELGGRFPEVFRAYLLKMGERAGLLFAGSEAGFARHRELRADALELLADDDHSASVLASAEVFLMHGGYQFMFVECTGGADGPVFLYSEGGQPEIVVQTFEDFLNQVVSQLETLNKDQKRNGGYCS